MSLSPGYSPRCTPSSSPVINSGIRKTTIDRSIKYNTDDIRLPKSFKKSRSTATRLHQAKMTALLEENNVLKNWWAIDMQDRPEIQEHNPDHQWRKSEVYFREPRRQALALCEYGHSRPECVNMHGHRNDDYWIAVRELVAARAELDEEKAARSLDLDMLQDAIEMRERESQQNERFNEYLNDQLDKVEAERDQLAKRVEELDRRGELDKLGEKLRKAEDALAVANEELDVAHQESMLARIMRALADRRLR